MYAETLRYLPFFRDIDPHLLPRIAKYISLKHYNKGELLFLHGDAIDYLFIISSGWIELFRNTFDGQEAFLGLATIGSVVGEIDFNKKFHLSSAKAIHETELLLFPAEILKESIEHNPMLGFKIIKILQANISLLELQLEHGFTMNAAQRVGCFMLRLASHQQTKNQIILPYDKRFIAYYLGMKNETFSRALNDLRLIGVNIQGNLLSITNIQDLINFTCISCSLTYDSCMEF